MKDLGLWLDINGDIAKLLLVTRANSTGSKNDVMSIDFLGTSRKEKTPISLSGLGVSGIDRTVPDYFLVAMQGLEPRTPRI